VNWTSLSLYFLTAILLIVSGFKDYQKTVLALKKAWHSLEGILPEFAGVIVLLGIMLTVVDPIAITNLIGPTSGWTGTLIAALIGSITLMPGVIAFPTAAVLLQNGAGYLQTAAFVSTLMMVGVITLPVEIKYLGFKVAILRNLMAFFFSLGVAVVIASVVGPP